jgi:hypothetical protein
MDEQTQTPDAPAPNAPKGCEKMRVFLVRMSYEGRFVACNAKHARMLACEALDRDEGADTLALLNQTCTDLGMPGAGDWDTAELDGRQLAGSCSGRTDLPGFIEPCPFYKPTPGDFTECNERGDSAMV